MKDREVAEVIAMCRVYWPHSQVADIDATVVLSAWVRLLGDLPFAAALAAVESLAAAGDRFSPPPGLIRRSATELLAEEGDAPSAEVAWAEVLAKIASIGWTCTLDRCSPRCVGRECDHHRVSWSHPAVETAVDGLGWQYLCLSENQMADRAHFMKFYGSAVERRVSQAAMPVSVSELLGSGVGELTEGADGG